MVIPRFVSRALDGQPLQVHGDGRQSRCFLHVGDVVEALVKLTEHAGAVGQVFNLGGQEEVTIEELARRVIRITGSRSTIQLLPYEEAYEEGYEDMPRRVPDTAKIRELIGFKPTKNLDQIIRSVVDSLRRPPAEPTPSAPPARRRRAAAAGNV
jgi:UDP-glucose 4-epimerase